MPVSRSFYYYHKHKLPKNDFYRFYFYISQKTYKAIKKIIPATYTCVRFFVTNLWLTYPDTLNRIRGKFTFNELVFLAEYTKSLNISYIGNFRPNMGTFFSDLDVYNQTYTGKVIDTNLLTSKLENLTKFELCCLQVCVMAYYLTWYGRKRPQIKTYFKKYLL